ncbi:hypothetical protein PanWU01x14_301680 [Parasponia andersonii]|uniref:Uncharacterized protein n=1 Tax=Parasponia andersonii TaxID=3476 RepID=A0A2P5ATT5_PARAD|nr:hypothetical protein PanWU01x14_301680 [Parasponia andersonii]
MAASVVTLFKQALLRTILFVKDRRSSAPNKEMRQLNRPHLKTNRTASCRDKEAQRLRHSDLDSPLSPLHPTHSNASRPAINSSFLAYAC